jgi:DNA-binding winged helix-turn-helix (wHTH) protein
MLGASYVIFSFKDFELDEEMFELRQAGSKVPVQPKVLELLFLLVRERARVVPKKDIFAAIWPGVVVGEASLARAAAEARKAIGDEAQETIVTVRGKGFRFAADVTARTTQNKQRAAVKAPLVGREACVEQLVARLDEGKGTITLLSGEAGIGKTRVAQEIAEIVRGRGETVVSAHCHPEGDAPPLWLWTQVTRALGAEPPPAEPFAALPPLMKALANVRLLVLEDLHCADARSLDLLRLVVRERSKLAIVGTFRDTSIADPSRAKAMGGLLRECEVIPLRELSAEDVARVVESQTGRAVTPRFAAALHEKSGGNPLYLKQLLGTEWAAKALDASHAVAASTDLQHGLLESIARHLDTLSQECRTVLAAAAVLGSDVDVASLSAISSVEPAELLDRLDEAARARALKKTAPGRYRFSHAVMRDVLYKAMPAAERASRHLAVADSLIAHYGGEVDAHAAQIAEHLLAALPAGNAARAVDLAQRAGDDLLARGDRTGATRWYARAMDALRYVRAPSAEQVDRVKRKLAELESLS